MRRRAASVLVVVLLPACRGGDHDAASPPVTVAAAPPRVAPDANLRAAPASQRAAAPAPPREAWPCAVEIDEQQGIHAHGVAVFAYGKRATCVLPRDVIALGIAGCPDTLTRRDTDGMVTTKQVGYDAGGHLVSIDGNVRITYTWDGDRLTGVARAQWGQEDRARFVDDGERVVAIDDQDRLQEAIAIDRDGRVTAVDEYLYGMLGGASTITWDAGWPVQVAVDVTGPVRGHVTRRFVYDCRWITGTPRATGSSRR